MLDYLLNTHDVLLKMSQIKNRLQIGYFARFWIISATNSRYSWVSLGYFAVNLSGGQPKIY